MGENKEMLWDESNMLKAIKIADQSIQHYIYDANGERTLKGKGILEALGINGEIQSLTGTNTIGNYAVYSSPYFVIGSNDRVTLHYYSGSDRIASRLAGASDIYNESGSELTGNNSGSLPTRQLADLQYVFTAFDLGTVDTENQPPVDGDCEAELNCPSELYFFHPDHIGSSTFLTDEDGNPYQFLLYLPFGESMAEQKAGGYSTKYRFTGKEVDEETGLYYFGARYYDPRISLWYGVDPMGEEMPDWSPYNYTLNNPIRLVDPDGRKPGNPQGPTPSVAGILYEYYLNADAAVFNFMVKGLSILNRGQPLKNNIQNLRKETQYGPNGELLGNEIVEKPNQSTSESIKETLGDALALTPIGGTGKGMTGPILAARAPVKITIISFIKNTKKGAEKFRTHLPEGFKREKGIYPHGQKVYTDGKRWISPDNTSHEGGVWKLWDNKKNVGTKTGRLTTDANLNSID